MWVITTLTGLSLGEDWLIQRVFEYFQFCACACHFLGFAQKAGGYGFVRVGFAAVGADLGGDVVEGERMLFAFEQDRGQAGKRLCFVADDAFHSRRALKPGFQWDGFGS